MYMNKEVNIVLQEMKDVIVSLTRELNNVKRSIDDLRVTIANKH